MPTLDPTLLALLSIFGGAALTVIAGFIGAGIQSRTEHAKWARERRYEGYVRAVPLLRKIQIDSQDQKALGAKIDDLTKRRPPQPDKPWDLERQMASSELDALRERYVRHNAEVYDFLAPLIVLGPEPVRAAVEAVSAALNDDDTNAYDAAEERLTDAMTAALGVKD